MSQNSQEGLSIYFFLFFIQFYAIISFKSHIIIASSPYEELAFITLLLKNSAWTASIL